MAIDIGDAVLTVLADTTQLDQTFAKVGAELPAKMAPATAAVQDTTVAVDGMTKQMAVGQSGAVELGSVVNLAGETSRESMYQARGEAGLLGEMFGITLPRHVRSFVAELPGIGPLLSEAFAATAILFIIEALAQGIEKINKWREHVDVLAAAWEKYDQTVFESGQHMQLQIDKQSEKLLAMASGPVAALDFALKHLETTAFETFSLITKDVETALKAMKEAESSLIGIQFNVFKDAGKDLEKFRLELEKTMRVAAEASPADPLAAYNAGITLIQQKEKDLTALIAQRTAASGKDASAAVDGLHAERQAVNDMLPLLQKGIDLQKDKKKVLEDERAGQLAQLDAAEAKRSLDQQLADIDNFKAKRHKAFEDHLIDLGTWQITETQAAAAARTAHETYLERVIGIYNKSAAVLKANAAAEQDEIKKTADGMRAEDEASKAHAAVQELRKLRTENEAKATETLAAAQQKHRDAVLAVEVAYAQLQERGIDKAWDATTTATVKATAAALKFAEAQGRLNAAAVTEHFGEQARAIQELAQFQIITEQQKADKLVSLYKQEEKALLDALNDTLAKERATIAATQDKLSEAKANPFITPGQIAQLQSLLDEAQKAEAHTQEQILKTKNEYQVKQLAGDKSFYGQALVLAIAFGNQLLATELKNNHESLVAAQAKLAEAKARGLNTAAIEQEIAALKKHEKELESDAAKGLKAWTQFSKGFQQQEKNNVQTMQKMGEEMRKDAQDTALAIGDAFAAVLSGQKSLGDAMIEETAQMIGKMAQKWAEYFAAMAIADIWGNPAKGAAEFAAAVALEAIAGALGSVGTSTGDSSSKTQWTGGTGSTTATDNSPATQSQPQPTGGVNVPHLAAGALITAPTLALVGDSRGGGSAREAVLPLDNADTMRSIAEAIGANGSGVTHNWYIQGGMISADTMSKVAKRVSRDVQSGRVRLKASDSARITRRS